jgi:hypothetical protein
MYQNKLDGNECIKFSITSVLKSLQKMLVKLTQDSSIESGFIFTFIFYYLMKIKS